jgi:protein gp37
MGKRWRIGFTEAASPTTIDGDRGIMANESGIEWLVNPDGSKGLTINPVVGCQRISPGCGGGYIKGPNGEQGGCWAEELVSTRMSKNPKLPMYHDLARPDGGWSGVVKLVPERLKDIVALGRRKKGSRVFVCDVSDLFHDKVPFDYIAAVFGAMACAPNHLFYVLTKRPARALEWAEWIASKAADRMHGRLGVMMHELNARCGGDEFGKHAFSQVISANGKPPYGDTTWLHPLPNVVFGVTVEDRRYGVPRLDLARKFPARWRWASVEPQLEDLADVDFSGIDLVVNGGEATGKTVEMLSGKKASTARPFDLQWARNVRDAARRAGARYFCKQLGDNVVENGVPLNMGRKGNVFERFPVDLRIRENLPMPA